jgi:hypothetical protein
VRYVEDMKKATLAEFDKAEVEWREIAERQVLHLCEIEDPLPTPEELDELGPDEAIRRIESVVENNTQLALPSMVTPAPGVRWLWRASRRGPRRKPKPPLNGCSLFNWIGPGEAAACRTLGERSVSLLKLAIDIATPCQNGEPAPYPKNSLSI